MKNELPEYNVCFVLNGFMGKFQQKSGKKSIMQLEWSKDFRDFNNKIEIVKGKTIPFLLELAKYVEELEK